MPGLYLKGIHGGGPDYVNSVPPATTDYKFEASSRSRAALISILFCNSTHKIPNTSGRNQTDLDAPPRHTQKKTSACLAKPARAWRWRASRGPLQERAPPYTLPQVRGRKSARGGSGSPAALGCWCAAARRSFVCADGGRSGESNGFRIKKRKGHRICSICYMFDGFKKPPECTRSRKDSLPLRLMNFTPPSIRPPQTFDHFGPSTPFVILPILGRKADRIVMSYYMIGWPMSFTTAWKN